MKAPGRHKGFTLIEVIVVIAIISIMTGIMIPMVYRVWEGNEEELTRQRMRDLKTAMVGDARLIQNGVRTSFGYVGDVGQLPSTLHNLIENDDHLSNWNGPYLPAGYDPAKFDKDAWGNTIAYVASEVSGKLASATLTSWGLDGTASTSDDIIDSDVQITADEVLPLSTVQGNLNVIFSSAPTSTATKNYYIGVTLSYKDKSNAVLYSSDICCTNYYLSVTGNSSNTQVNYPQSFVCTAPTALPLGMLYLRTKLYSNADCSANIGSSSELAYVAGGSTIFGNFLVQAVTP